MISILIPIYNYDITKLVVALREQIVSLGIPYEIIGLEDGSNNKQLIKTNQTLNNYNNTNIIVSSKNQGRTLTRQLLANKAAYEWLLFLDADVIPKNNNFIKNYLYQITNNKDIDIVYGGFTYTKEPPSNNNLLRWVYGKKREDLSAKKRSLHPFKTIISANILIKKECFTTVNLSLNENRYGYDNLFSAELKRLNYKVKHINNEVYHFGLETSAVFIKKKERAAETLLLLYQEKKYNNLHENRLLNTYIKLYKLKLNTFIYLLFKLFKTTLKKNLLSKNPLLPLLDFYQLGYFCSLTQKNNA